MTPLLVVPRRELAVPAWQPPLPPASRVCTAPHCSRTSRDGLLHRHHAVARSQQRSILGVSPALDWLEIRGEMVCVVIMVCREHHHRLESDVGGAKSRLRWLGGWAWYDRLSKVSMPTGPIVWFDKENQTYWRLRGFCKGEYRRASDHS